MLIHKAIRYYYFLRYYYYYYYSYLQIRRLRLTEVMSRQQSLGSNLGLPDLTACIYSLTNLPRKGGLVRSAAQEEELPGKRSTYHHSRSAPTCAQLTALTL